MKFENSETYPVRDVFRRMNSQGELIDPNHKVDLTDEEMLEMYKGMCKINEMDNVFYDSQRQGRISFYMTAFGEEATHIGSAAALGPNDEIFSQYREQGVILWRGFGIQQVAHQLFSNELDLGKGRQMPVHYGSRELNFQTISSPLATQIPQACGAAYAMKGSGNCAVTYFGEGAASEGDFHAALNMATTLSCPVIFFCRNNGYAISTPVKDQYAGDGIVSRAAGYGMHSIRVDGNDILAVHEVTKEARRLAVEENKPILIEAMTYRGGHHSTSDDSTRYRETEEIAHWLDNQSPIARFRLMLERKGLWDSDQETALRTSLRKEVLAAMGEAEDQLMPPVSEMFSDTYKELPRHLQEQAAELAQHLEKYGEHYDLHDFVEDEEYKNPGLVNPN